MEVSMSAQICAFYFVLYVRVLSITDKIPTSENVNIHGNKRAVLITD